MANQLGIKRVNGVATAQVEELYMLRYASDEEAANVVATLSDDNADWFSCLSLRGTVSVGQEASSLEKIQVDQFDQPIGITVEPGDFTFEFFMPSFEKTDLMAWLGSDVKELSAASEGVDGYSLDLSGQIYTMSILIKTKIGPTPYMLFSRVQSSVALSQEDKVFGLRVTGQVLSPAHSTNKGVYFIKNLPSQVAPESISLDSTKAIKVGEVAALQPVFTPEVNVNTAVTWESSAPAKVSVDDQGHITGVAQGQAIITCTSVADKNVTATCTVSVTN